jgi:hypothetical protein
MLRNMLKGNPSVFPYTTFATADKVFAQHPIWQQAKVEAERKLIFEEYVNELKQQEMVFVLCYQCHLCVKAHVSLFVPRNSKGLHTAGRSPRSSRSSRNCRSM